MQGEIPSGEGGRISVRIGLGENLMKMERLNNSKKMAEIKRRGPDPA